MTRQEFLDEIFDIGDLVNFAHEYGYEHVVEYVYSQDSYNDWVWESIHDWWGSDWEELCNWLDNLPGRGDYDYYDLSDNPCGVGDYEFNLYLNEMLEALDENDFFEDGGEDVEDNPRSEYILDREPKPEPQDPEECERFLTLLTA